MEFNRYYRYDELTAELNAIVGRHPGLVQIESAGKSYEGRDIWVLTLTNLETGPAAEKPGFWVAGNVHSSELSASTACLYLIDHLLADYGRDADITRLLDSRTLYVCPRINPDGAEWSLETPPRLTRSSTRPYPFPHDRPNGLVEQDVDGDGRLLLMRIPDPNGGWKKHPDEPRLMMRRDPIETGGEYFRVIAEGLIENYDGVQIPVSASKQGLDLNRNYPAGWRQEHEQPGAGPFPTSEPEIRAVVDYVVRHANITGGVDFHTYSGVLLRPYADKADGDMPPEDLWVYQAVGEKGAEITGYPAISIYHDFRYHPKQVITGGFDWLYTHLGAFMWAVEIWSPQREAGIEDYKYIDWFRDHSVEDDLKMLAWADTALEGEGYIDWYAFEHPQLGKIELGGWNAMHAFRNPPPQFLEREVARFPKWVIWQALISPKLELLQARTEQLGEELWRVEIAVQNTGWLPSYVSKIALERKVVRGLAAEIGLPEGCALAGGTLIVEGGQLEGRSHLKSLIGFGRVASATPDRARFEWNLRGPKGAEIEIAVKHDRAGTVRCKVVLG
ncbi:MAG TPA: M14 family metallopeptidase [Aliidongia sp.]|nr:M14 family metallopeptidase [Aliidongia sp.]